MAQLPSRPDLRHLRDEAKRRRRAGESPTISAAQLAIAREYGFVSWPRLKAHVDAICATAADRAQILVRSACSSDPRRAQAVLAVAPGSSAHDLASACVCGDAETVARVLARNASAAHSRTGPDDREPILLACFSRLGRTDAGRQAGIRACVEMLLHAGADPNASFLHGDTLQTALYGAAGIAGDPALTAMLLDAGADPNDARPPHRVGEALYHACEHRDPECARLLIEAGTDPLVVDYCLGRALNFDNPAMVEMFCARGARPSADNLMQAVWRNRPARTVAALLDAGAPADARDDAGRSALQVAEAWGDRQVTELLRSSGAGPGGPARTGSSDDGALLDDLLSFAVQRGDESAARALLDAGARVDGPPDAEWGPLGEACWRGFATVAAELVARGARLTWGERGSAIGATLHGSRHCNAGEAGPTMGTRAEIPREPYAQIARMLLANGAVVPDRVGGEHGPHGLMVLAELGVV